MSLQNNLPQVEQAFRASLEALRMTQVITANIESYQALAEEMPVLIGYHQQDTNLNRIRKELEDSFLVTSWAVFERFLRDYIEQKGHVLETVSPPDFGKELYEHFGKAIEYSKPEDILDMLKKLPDADAQIISQAKKVYRYRNWVAHGRKPSRQPEQIEPNDAYLVLNALVILLNPHCS